VAVPDPMRVIIGLTKPRRAVIGLGAYAEYTCMKETDSRRGCLAHKPANISFEAATVAAYGGLLALQYLDKGNLRRGQRVLIYGASGTCGTTAVQIAKYRGAHVTGVCSTAHLELDSGRLAVLTNLVEAGHVKPIINRCYPLEKIVEAHSYVGEGHKKGGVAITI
jgi:NADPH:quinone reductase-like Zn-dependent oxidoreductase